MGNKEQTKVETKTNRQMPNKLWIFLKENGSLLITILTLFFTFGSIIVKGVGGYIYAIEAERFYGILKNYFFGSVNILGDMIVGVIYIIVVVLLLFSPVLIKKILKKNKLGTAERIGYSLILALLICYILLEFSEEILINTLKWRHFIPVLLVICIAVAAISFIVYFIIFGEDFNIGNIKDTNQRTDDAEKHNKRRERIVSIFSLISVIVIFMVMILEIKSGFIDNRPEMIKAYEIVETGESESKVVVGYYNGSAILMNFETKEDDKGEILFLERGSYVIQSIEGKRIVYKQFSSVRNEGYGK